MKTPITKIVNFLKKLLQKIEHVLMRVSLFKNWYYIVPPLNRINYFVTKERVFYFRNGLKIKSYDIRSSEFHTIFEVIGGKNYGSPETFCFKKNPVFIDIGANIGAFSLWFAQLLPHAKIFAFEPHPQTFQKLTENIELNNFKIKSYNMAVTGKEEKTKQLFLHPRHSTCHGFYNTWGGNNESISVNCISFNSFLKKLQTEVDFLKIDAEGSEYDIIFNTPYDLLKKVKNIAMECHDIETIPYKPDNMIYFLEQSGFQTTHNKYTHVIFAKRK